MAPIQISDCYNGKLAILFLLSWGDWIEKYKTSVMLVVVYAARKSNSVLVFYKESNMNLRLLVFELLRNGEPLRLIDRTGVQKGHIFVWVGSELTRPQETERSDTAGCPFSCVVPDVLQLYQLDSEWQVHSWQRLTCISMYVFVTYYKTCSTLIVSWLAKFWW